MDDINFKGVPAPMVRKLWHFAEPYIKRALDHTHGEITPDQMRDFCVDRDMQLWMAAKGHRVIGAGTTQIVTYPNKTVLRIVAMAGNNFDEWRDMVNSQIELWAIEQGCSGIEAFVRKGFVPKMVELGYKHRYSVVHKELKG